MNKYVVWLTVWHKDVIEAIDSDDAKACMRFKFANRISGCEEFTIETELLKADFPTQPITKQTK